MASEIELKLEVPAAQIRRLAHNGWLDRLSSGSPKKTKLTSVYYDTDKLALRARDAILRVRAVGGKYVQTIKVDAKGARGPFGRLEWECELDRPRPDVGKPRKKELDGLNVKKFRKRLKPVFETVVSRRSIPVSCDGSALEVGLDLGQVRTGRKRCAIHEIEVELKA
jgi:inorganic triphosphatase YgiF